MHAILVDFFTIPWNRLRSKIYDVYPNEIMMMLNWLCGNLCGQLSEESNTVLGYDVDCVE